jgi:hypothetical protein
VRQPFGCRINPCCMVLQHLDFFSTCDELPCCALWGRLKTCAPVGNRRFADAPDYTISSHPAAVPRDVWLPQYCSILLIPQVFAARDDFVLQHRDFLARRDDFGVCTFNTEPRASASDFCLRLCCSVGRGPWPAADSLVSLFECPPHVWLRLCCSRGVAFQGCYARFRAGISENA